MLVRYKSLYLPALIIVGTICILLFVIAVSTYRNLNKERTRMEDAFLREGRAIIHAVEAAIRADDGSLSPDIGRLMTVLENVSKGPDIAGISILTREGYPVAWSSPAERSRRISSASLIVLLRDKGIVTRYGHDHAGERILEVIQPFSPLLFKDIIPVLEEEGGGDPRRGSEPEPTWLGDKIIAISFHLKLLEASRSEDMRHVILMGMILLVLGSGTLYFLFILRRYYLVDLTLAHMKTYTENVVDSMADGLISLDRHGNIVTLNRQMAGMLGTEIADLQGRRIAHALGGGIASLADDAHGQIIRDRELVLQSEGIGAIPVSVSAAPLKDETGQEMGVTLLIRDLREIHELKEKVRRSEKLASLGRLAAGIAHEIRNPLSSIRGFAQLFLKRFQGQKEEQEYAAIMVKEVDRLNRVITELLDYANPKTLRREACSLESVVDYALTVLAMDIKRKKVVIGKVAEDGLPPVWADQEQLSQAFLNVLINALEAVDEEGRIDIRLTEERARGVVRVVVADNGRGILPEDREKIFEPFFSTKRKGTGLGLAIVHQIIESHGGEIGVRDLPDRGTSFIIDLPVVRPAAPPHRVPEGVSQTSSR